MIKIHLCTSEYIAFSLYFILFSILLYRPCDTFRKNQLNYYMHQLFLSAASIYISVSYFWHDTFIFDVIGMRMDS